MIIEGKAIKVKFFGSYCAIILDVGKSFVRALAYSDIPIIEGENLQLEGHFRNRGNCSEFFSEVLKKC